MPKQLKKMLARIKETLDTSTADESTTTKAASKDVSAPVEEGGKDVEQEATLPSTAKTTQVAEQHPSSEKKGEDEAENVEAPQIVDDDKSEVDSTEA